MNQEIKITVNGKIATTDFSEIVTFNSVYLLKFVLDEEWEEFPSRVAVVKWADGAAEKLFQGTECAMPEIDSPNADQVLIGVYSIKDGKRIASSFVKLRCEAGTGGCMPSKPVHTLHDQVLALLNEEHRRLDNPLTIGDKTYNGSESVTVTSDDLGLADVATSGSYNDLKDKPEIVYPVTSVNGRTGDVTVSKYDLALSEVAISGSYTDLKDKPEIVYPVTSVNGEKGDVSISAESLGLAEVATSGNFSDLKGVPETGVLSVNGQSGEVSVTPESLGLGALAMLDGISSEQIGDSAVLGKHISQGAVDSDKLGTSSVTAKALADKNVTAPKLADGVVAAGTGTFVERGEDGVFTVGLDPSAAVTSVNGEKGAVTVDAASLGLAKVATSGNFSDLEGVPETGVLSVNGESGAVTVDAESLGLAKVATSGKFSDLVDAPEEGVLSVNGQTGAVTVDAASLGLAEVATSGNFSDLKGVPETGVLSVNGQSGAVTVDAESLGLAKVATSGKFSDLEGTPKEGVLSVNGESGEVSVTPESLGLGALAMLDGISSEQIGDSAVLGRHISQGAVDSDKLGTSSVTAKALADKNVTAIKIADNAVKAGSGISVTREEEGGAFVVGMDPNGSVNSVNGQTGAVEITKETLGLTYVTSERQMPLAAETRRGADFDLLFPNGFYHIEGTESDPCKNSPVSMKNTGYDDCSWFLLVMANSDNSAAVQVAFSARGDFSIRMRGFANGAWSKWSNIPA